MSDWVKIREKIIDVFAKAPRPNLDTVSIIGCCERHEQDFDWYRRHTWQEFENAIETRGFDAADFVAIHPLAFHYFTPGVLSTAIKRLVTDSEKYWDDESWIRLYIIAPYRLDDFKKQYLPHFKLEQRLAVSEILEWYQHWFLAQKGCDYDEPDDTEEDSGKISETIAFVWQSES
jgi:hypothetical protein